MDIPIMEIPPKYEDLVKAVQSWAVNHEHYSLQKKGEYFISTTLYLGNLFDADFGSKDLAEAFIEANNSFSHHYSLILRWMNKGFIPLVIFNEIEKTMFITAFQSLD